MTDSTRHTDALARAGNVFAWAMHEGGHHPDATYESAAEQITAMYLRELRDAGSTAAEIVLNEDFPEDRR